MRPLWMLLCFLFFSLAVFAQEFPEDKTNLKIDLVTVSDPALAADAERAMTEDIIRKSHEIIEGEETGERMKDWLEAVNFKKKVIDSMRWAGSTKGTPGRNVVLDSAILFGISHGLETASGPIFVTAGVANDWNPIVTSVLGTIGGIISIPGLDPLCYIVFATYFTQPGFRAVVGHVRIGLVRTVTGLMNLTGVNQLIKKTFHRPNYKEWLAEIEHLDSLRQTESGKLIAEYSFPSKDAAQIRFEIQVEQERPFLREIHVREDLTVVQRQRAETWLKNFGWNARNFLNKTVIRDLGVLDPHSKAYVDAVETTDGWRVYKMKGSAISVGPRFTLTPPPTCKNIFRFSNKELSALELGVL